MVDKVRWMALDMTKDAEMKVRAVQFFRDQYHRSLVYQVGELVYHMRDRFKQMVRLYQITQQNLTYTHVEETENIPTMVKVFIKGQEINEAAFMIQDYHEKKETKEEFHQRKKRIIRNRRMGGGSELLQLQRAPSKPLMPLNRPQPATQLRGAGADAASVQPRSVAPPTQAPSTAPPSLAAATRNNNKWRKGARFI